MIVRKSADEIETMARAGRVVAETLALMGETIRPGISTRELDDLAEGLIRSRGGVPTFKGYRGFPASICASPNDMVVHGIPGGYRVAEGTAGSRSDNPCMQRRCSSEVRNRTEGRNTRNRPVFCRSCRSHSGNSSDQPPNMDVYTTHRGR